MVSKKKAAEARLAAQESGVELDDTGRDEDIFELQHHHLLRCLERTTVKNYLGCGNMLRFLTCTNDFTNFMVVFSLARLSG